MENPAEIVKELMTYQHEEEWFEFKTNWADHRAIGEYISALSNAAAMCGRAYGYMVWGITDDDHDVVGTTFNPSTNVKGEPLKHYLARNLTPDTAFEFYELFLADRNLVLLEIAAAKGVPTAFDGIRYTRIGSSKVSLAKHPSFEARLFNILNNGFPTLENTEVSLTDDLTFTKLFMYYAGEGVELKKTTFKKNLRLLTSNGSPNALAQLLSDNSRMPIRISVFRGRDKTSELYSVKEFGNDCLLVSLDKVLEYLDVINVIQADESNRSMVRTDVALFSRRAMREAVINAFLHNNYLYGIAPAFTVYSDRIEILSRGVLAPGQTREGFFLGESMPVNKGLSDIFLQLHISERSGRGVPIIVEEYGRSAYEFRENSIVVTIPFNRVYAEDAGNSNNYSFGTVASAKSTKTKDIQSKILDALVKDNSLKLDELAQSFGVSKATVSKAVAALKRDGKLKRVGSNKTGYWQVINL